MAEVLELNEPIAMQSSKSPAKLKSIPPISDFFRKRSPKKPKVVLGKYPNDNMDLLDESLSSTSEDNFADDVANINVTTDHGTVQSQSGRKQLKMLTQKHSTEKSEDCSTCPLCLMFGKPSKKPQCPPNSPLLR